MKITEISTKSNSPRRKPITTEQIKKTFDDMKQDMSNATIDLSPYDKPGFRVMQIDRMIEKLTRLRNWLETDEHVSNASETGNVQGALINRAKKK